MRSGLLDSVIFVLFLWRSFTYQVGYIIQSGSEVQFFHCFLFCMENERCDFLLIMHATNTVLIQLSRR